MGVVRQHCVAPTINSHWSTSGNAQRGNNSRSLVILAGDKRCGWNFRGIGMYCLVVVTDRVAALALGGSVNE